MQTQITKKEEITTTQKLHIHTLLKQAAAAGLVGCLLIRLVIVHFLNRNEEFSIENLKWPEAQNVKGLACRRQKWIK